MNTIFVPFREGMSFLALAPSFKLISLFPLSSRKPADASEPSGCHSGCSLSACCGSSGLLRCLPCCPLSLLVSFLSSEPLGKDSTPQEVNHQLFGENH